MRYRNLYVPKNAISIFDTFSSYHIVRTRIAKVTASFSLFALSELVCTKKVPYPIHYSLLIYPKLILLWSVPDRLTEKIVHPLFPKARLAAKKEAIFGGQYLVDISVRRPNIDHILPLQQEDKISPHRINRYSRYNRYYANTMSTMASISFGLPWPVAR